MLNEEQLQIITLKASYVHEHADRPYFRNELNRVGETLHEAAYLNFFVRYRTESAKKSNIDPSCTNSGSNNRFGAEGSPSTSTHRWSRINKVIYLSEWNERAKNNNNNNSGDNNNNNSSYSNNTLLSQESSSFAQYDPLANATRNDSEQEISRNRPRLVIDTSFEENGLQSPSSETQVAVATGVSRQSTLPSYIIWRQKTFWVALMVEGEVEPVLISRLSTKPPTEDEVAAFCSHQMRYHPGQTYRDGELSEDMSKVATHESKKQTTSHNSEIDNATTTTTTTTSKENDDGNENGNNEPQNEKGEDETYDIWGSSLDPRDYLPTHTQIDKLRQFRQRRITQHQWTDDEIQEAKELNARFSQAGVAATPVDSTLNKLHNMKLESELSLAQRIRLGDTHALSAATIAAANKNTSNKLKMAHEYGNPSELLSKSFASMSGSPSLVESTTSPYPSASSPQSSSSVLLEMSSSSRRVPRFDEVNPLTQLPVRKRRRDFMAEQSNSSNTEEMSKNDMHETCNNCDDSNNTLTTSQTHVDQTSQNVQLPPSSPHSPFLPRKLKARALQQFIKSASHTLSAQDANSNNTEHTTASEPVNSAYDHNIVDNEIDIEDDIVVNNDPWERSTSVYENNNNTGNTFSPTFSSMNATTQSIEESEATTSALSSHVVDEETIEQWRKMAEQERAFYTYISNPDRSAYLNKVTAISIRNAELNKRNRRRGIANERRLERKGNLLESGGLWVTDDAERARKAAEYKASLEMTGLNEKTAEKSDSANAKQSAQTSSIKQTNGQVSNSNNNKIGKEGIANLETGHAQLIKKAATITPTYDFGSLMNELFDAELQEQTTSGSETLNSNQEHLTDTTIDSKDSTDKEHVYKDEEQLASPTRNLLLSETRYRLIRFDESFPLKKDIERNDSNRTNFFSSKSSNINENNDSSHRNDECDNSSSWSVATSSSSPLLVTSQLLHYSAAHSARRKLQKDNTLQNNLPQAHEISGKVTVDNTAHINDTHISEITESRRTGNDETKNARGNSTLKVTNNDDNNNSSTSDNKSMLHDTSLAELTQNAEKQNNVGNTNHFKE